MLLEILLVLQCIAFGFLALGNIPFKRDLNSGNLPLANKVVFLMIAAIMFFSLSAATSQYEIQNCYLSNVATSGYDNVTVDLVSVQTQVCTLTAIEDVGWSTLNLGGGILSILLAIIVMILALASKNDPLYDEGED